MLNPVVPKKYQQLPNSFVRQNSEFPKPENRKYEVAALLNPNNDEHISAQGLSYRPGYPGAIVGADYGTPTSSM